MPNAEDIKFFKGQFHQAIEAAVANTPFDVDMVTAVACQETGHIWQVLRKKQMTIDQLLALCVGDTIDAKPNGKGRKAFPKNKAALVAVPRGQEMFQIARQALLDMAQHIPGFKAAAANPNKFCRGYGVFQLDLQFFKDDPDYFLEKRYEKFSESLAKCLGELRSAQSKTPFKNKTQLSDMEFAGVAIAYNTGGFNPSKGLKQGFFDGTKFYGERIFDFLRLSRTVAIPGQTTAPLPTPPPGQAIVPPPKPVEATGPLFTVETNESTLRLRSAPRINKQKPTDNVIADLPEGQVVRAVTGQPVNGFLEVETSLAGAHLRGFASAKFLTPTSAATSVPVVALAAAAPTSGIVAVFMPRTPGSVTKRTAIAGAHSLNEPGQPGRGGATPDELRAELAKIIDFLAVEKPAHKRYKPRDRLTFCNIYTHDYCFLSNVYLPRVWWTPGAIERLARNETVEPKLGNTIEEMRANALFRWLRDFGPRFGWRQAASLSELQQEVNQGAVGLIVARRKEEGRSGHMVAVVPETVEKRALRNAAGDVTKPLQSQAGETNFRFGLSTPNWWRAERFAESAFWLHA